MLVDHPLKTKKELKKIIETSDSRYVYQNELDKACFQHGLAYGHFNDLPRRTPADKVLDKKAFNMANNSKYDVYQCGIALMIYKFFHKKTSDDAV